MNRIPAHLRFDRSIKVADLVSQFDVLLLAGSLDKLLTMLVRHKPLFPEFLSLYDEGCCWLNCWRSLYLSDNEILLKL